MDNQNSGVMKQTKDAVTDPEHSLGENAPGAPFAVVALSYLAILAVGSVLIAIAIWAT